MPATIRDVAKRAGVGVATVSRVLNNSGFVSAAARQNVMQAVEALNYVPNPTARRLSLGKTFTVAVIVPFFTRPSFVERLRGIDSVFADSRYDMIVFNVETTQKRDKYFAEVPRRDRTDGVIIVTLTPNATQVAAFKESGIPVVLVDTHYAELPSIMEDSVVGGRLATQHLIDLGHRRIAYLSDVLDEVFSKTAASIYRFQGYQQALADAGIPLNTDYVKTGRHSREEARRCAAELLALPERPTAIFAASDTQAIGVMEAARDFNLRVPDDLSVVGYDDLDVAAYLGLTTVRQSLFESGQRGAELLLAAMEGNHIEPARISMPVELVIRQSSHPIDATAASHQERTDSSLAAEPTPATYRSHNDAEMPR
jgi:DNA-binding LacI/PurR family transcriptional regulator